MTRLAFDELKDLMLACSGTDGAVEIVADSAEVEFEDLGFDSLAVLEVVTQIQRRYGITIPDEDLAEITTPASLLNYVNTRLAAV